MTRGRIDDAVLSDRVHRYLTRRLLDATTVHTAPAAIGAWSTLEPVAVADALEREYLPVRPGDAWGRPWSTTWFRLTGVAPAQSPGSRVELEVDLGFREGMPGFQAEGMAYDAHGRVLKAINPSTRWVPITPGEPYEVYVEAAANPTILVKDPHGEVFTPTPLGDPATAGEAPFYALGPIRAVVLDLETERLRAELEVLTGMAWALEETSARRARVLAAVDRALDALDTTDLRGTAAAAREILSPVLRASGAPDRHDITAVGHAHIDSAWLWPFRETRRKVARTVANVLDLLDRDPDLVYAMSSAQQYAWLQEDHPQLFERLRERVREGRFVPVGGMWVESDVLMPSGESLVRQFLHGSGYFEREFGIASTVGWLPDSFGYSAALPQLLRSAGMTRFVTQKMSWNTVNRFPHHSFVWEGIDGSRVITHFPTVDTYNSELTGAELAHAAANLSDPDLLDASLVPFGFGDGGGGPTREMLERARLGRDLEGAPRVTIAAPDRFFDALEGAVDRGARIPRWLGEMYLESCRGTFTSQARTKAAHRRAEQLLREAELWASQATIRHGGTYPYEVLDECWRELLLMEFHDVLPGSSIAWVHDEAVRRLDRVSALLEDLIDRALVVLGDAGAEPVLANPAPFAVDGVPGHALGRPVPTVDRVTVSRDGAAIRLTNAALEVAVDPITGLVVSAVDRASGREMIAAGLAASRPTLHRDAPARWDAWDIDESVDSVVEVLDGIESIAVEETDEGAGIRVERRFGGSRLIQLISLRAGASLLEFELEVDWRESERLLKIEFPLAVATDRWQAETQYGYIERPTHRNTSWDAARFEAVAHRWVRVGETGWGAAILNDRSYGFDALRITDGDGLPAARVRASVLRASRFPDPGADQGVHRFRFALAAAPDIVDAVHAAYRFTAQPRRRHGAATRALVSSSNPSVVVDAVKLAEDRSGDLIVRLFESRGASATTRLELDIAGDVVETDILERELDDAPDISNLRFPPFRVRTFRITGPTARPRVGSPGTS